MTQRRSTSDAIRLRGVRHNNLKNFDLDIPVGQLTVITGLSGSGKSSLAFDTLFAEGQRRYIETFSPYARQFFDRMDKPQVDRIEGIPPAIAIEQRNAVRSTRSTVGTMTEICDYLKVVWPHLARLHCRQCSRLVRTEPPQVVWERIREEWRDSPDDCLVTFDLPLSQKLSLAESLALIARQGYQRLWIDQEIVRLEDAAGRLEKRMAKAGKGAEATPLTIIQDRIKPTDAHRARFIEACEQAYHFGKGRLTIRRTAKSSPGAPVEFPFSKGFHCAVCDLDYPSPTPALFSFNHPLGACPACKGFGRIISIDYELAIPDRSKTLAGGAIRPWQTGVGAESQADLKKFCKMRGVPMDVPFFELPDDLQRWVIDGDAGYDSNDPENSWPRKWYGVKGYFRWLESKSYKMHVRVLLSRYRAYTTCASCAGQRLKPEAVLYRVALPGPPATKGGPTAAPAELSLPEFYALSIERALQFIEGLAVRPTARRNDPLSLALGEVRLRLRYLDEVGLGYLTLDRPTRTLSGGETERVNLTTCLGTRLVNTLFVLDEPSVGLHPRDTARLVQVLEQLRDAGNTVVVVEHEAGVIRAADQVVDLGPGQGEQGGHIVFCGSLEELFRDAQSLTGRYLSGRTRIEIPRRRPVLLADGGKSQPSTAWEGQQFAESPALYRAAPPTASLPVLTIRRAQRNNLKNLTVEIPLGRFVALTGVSGSGKTTLVREVLMPALQARLSPGGAAAKASDRLDDAETGEDPEASAVRGAQVEGWESLRGVVLVDQSALGKTPRSNPVVYMGAFDDVRDLFAQSDLARQRGLNSSAFSFNSGVGQCERCRGAGFEKIEMQFLSDVFIRCPECDGRRYRGHILEVKLRGPHLPGRGAASLRSPDAVSDGSHDAASPAPSNEPAPRVVDWNIANMLEATVDEALTFLDNYIHLPAGRRAIVRLKLLQDVGLGYLRLGQPINTLSGGESQRLKLVSHLAESAVAQPVPPVEGGVAVDVRNTRADVKAWLAGRKGRRTGAASKRPAETASQAESSGDSTEAAPHSGTLFLFDEPTTGLHFDDVRVLLQVFQRMVDAGHSVVVIEHNLDVIKCADWVIDLGPDAGENGGSVVATGSPEAIAACEASHTGHYLREVLAEKLAKPARAHSR